MPKIPSRNFNFPEYEFGGGEGGTGGADIFVSFVKLGAVKAHYVRACSNPYP
jgi:hypothetical protein